jgi:hypothetical protein
MSRERNRQNLDNKREAFGLPPSEERVLSHEEINHFALKYRAAWQKSVTSIVAVGQMLLDDKNGTNAVEKVPHGQWGDIFKSPHAPFRSQTARHFMRIAEHAVLSDPKHASDLPCSWYNLFLLHHVSPDRLLCLIREKEVHAEIQREQIDEILRREKSRVRREQTVPDSAHSDSPEPSHPEGDRLEPEQRQDKAPPRSLDDLCSAQQLIVDEVKEHYQDEVRLNPFQEPGTRSSVLLRATRCNQNPRPWSRPRPLRMGAGRVKIYTASFYNGIKVAGQSETVHSRITMLNSVYPLRAHRRRDAGATLSIPRTRRRMRSNWHMGRCLAQGGGVRQYFGAGQTRARSEAA